MDEGVNALSDLAAEDFQKLRHLRNFERLARGGGNSAKVKYVKCLSSTPAGAGAILSECYPAQILEPAADKSLPPESASLVLLTLIGSAGAAVAPVADGVYLCVMAGDVEYDAAGSLAGRARAFGVPVSVGGSSPLTTKGDIYTYDTADVRLPVGTNGQVLSADSTTATGLQWITPNAGTVTSVAATAPAAGFTISGGPITSAGTFTFTLANDLAAVEGLSGTGIAVRTATDTWTARTVTAGTGITVTNGDGVSGQPTVAISASYVGQSSITTLGTVTTGVWNGTTIAVANGGTGATTASGARTNLGVAIGSDVQAYSANLAAIAGLTSAANKLPYFTGSGTATVTDFTATAISLLDDTSTGAMLTTLGGTTVGQAIFTLANPSAIRFIRINADNTVTARTAAELASDLGVSAPTVGSTTSDVTISSSTFADVTGLSFAVGASETWDFEFVLGISAPATAQGLRFQLTGPSSPTALAFVVNGGASSETQMQGERVSGFSTSTGLLYVAYQATSTANGMVRIAGRLRNGANSGTVQLQAKLNTGGLAPNQEVLAESCVRASKN